MKDHFDDQTLLQAAFERALTLAGMGYLIWNLETGDIVVSDQIFDLLGITKSQDPIALEWILAFVQPEDRELVRKSIQQAVRERTPYCLDHRLMRNDGEIIWVHAQGELLDDTDDSPPHMIITLIDISDRKNNELLLFESDFHLKQLTTRFQEYTAFDSHLLRSAPLETNMVGKSKVFLSLMKDIDSVALSDSTVLILGETGTGKELVANNIHTKSMRAYNPYVVVNCSSIPNELYESEFFGHEKGAFTGAIAARSGRFELADGGTIFLDEIAEIPFHLQSKLLRIIETGEYDRIGSDKTRKVDVRIIAATNRDLKREVEEKRFREDLYYRLNVFQIVVPPLRKRKPDIKHLALHFISDICDRSGRCMPRLTQANIAELEAYDWPGNIRELQNIIGRTLLRSCSETILFDLPVSASAISDELFTPAMIHTPAIASSAEMKQRECKNIIKALQRTRGTIFGPTGAALLLGLRPTTLISRMKRFGIDKSDFKNTVK